MPLPFFNPAPQSVHPQWVTADGTPHAHSPSQIELTQSLSFIVALNLYKRARTLNLHTADERLEKLNILMQEHYDSDAAHEEQPTLTLV